MSLYERVKAAEEKAKKVQALSCENLQESHLHCVACGDCYIHIVQAYIVRGNNEGGSIKGGIVSRLGVERRDALVFTYTCEGCRRSTTTRLQLHKGWVLVQNETTECEHKFDEPKEDSKTRRVFLVCSKCGVREDGKD